MAFQTNAVASNNVSSFEQAAKPVGQNDSWKSDRFINIWVPSKGGKSSKLGTIGLKLSRPKEAALIQRLDNNPNDIEALKEVLTLTYESAEGNSAAEFEF